MQGLVHSFVEARIGSDGLSGSSGVDHATDGRGSALVAENDIEIRRWLERLLHSYGLAVASVPDADRALAVVDEGPVDVVAMGQNLPGGEPTKVTRRLREACGLLLVVVPGSRRLVSADQAASGCGGVRQTAEPSVSRLGDLEIDWRNLHVRRGGKRIELSHQDLRLLCTLITHNGEVLSRRVLLRWVWGYDYLGSSRMIDMAIRRLRERIEEDPASPRYIHTERGQGYRFEVR